MGRQWYRRRTLLADEAKSIELTLIIGTTPNAHSKDALVTTVTLANGKSVDFGDDNDNGCFTTGEISTAETDTLPFDEFVTTILADSETKCSEKKQQGGGDGKKGKSKHSHSSKGKGT